MVDQLQDFDVINYQPKSVVRSFSSIPHVDHALKRVDGTFDIESEEYIESVVILTIIPAGCLVVSFIVLCIYAICSCICWRKSTRKRLHKIRILIGVLTILTIVSTIPSYIGNAQLHRGVTKAQKVIHGVDDVLAKMATSADQIHYQLSKLWPGIEMVMGQYRKASKEHPEIKELDQVMDTLESIMGNIKMYETKINVQLQKLDAADLDKIIHYIEFGEKIRFAVTTSLGVLVLLFVVLPLPAMIWRWHCFLRMFNVLGFVALLVMGIFTAVYFGIGVVGSDFCVDPNTVIVVQLDRIGISSDDTIFVLTCENGSIFGDVTKALEEMSDTFIPYLLHAYDDIPNFDGKEDLPELGKIATGLNTTVVGVYSMIDIIDCQITVLKLYGNILDFLCNDSIPALVVLFISYVFIAFLFTVLLFITIYYSDHHIWENKPIFKKNKKSGSNEYDDNEHLHDEKIQTDTLMQEKRRDDDEYGKYNEGVITTIDERSIRNDEQYGIHNKGDTSTIHKRSTRDDEQYGTHNKGDRFTSDEHSNNSDTLSTRNQGLLPHLAGFGGKSKKGVDPNNS